jgi:hypothetical protein
VSRLIVTAAVVDGAAGVVGAAVVGGGVVVATVVGAVSVVDEQPARRTMAMMGVIRMCPVWRPCQCPYRHQAIPRSPHNPPGTPQRHLAKCGEMERETPGQGTCSELDTVEVSGSSPATPTVKPQVRRGSERVGTFGT